MVFDAALVDVAVQAVMKHAQSKPQMKTGLFTILNAMKVAPHGMHDIPCHQGDDWEVLVIKAASRIHGMLAQGVLDSKHSLASCIRQLRHILPPGLHRRLRQLSDASNAMRHVTKSGLDDLIQEVETFSFMQPIFTADAEPVAHDPSSSGEMLSVAHDNFSSASGEQLDLPSMPLWVCDDLDLSISPAQVVGTSVGAKRIQLGTRGSTITRSGVQTELVGKWVAMSIDEHALDEVMQAYSELLSVCQLHVVAPVEHKLVATQTLAQVDRKIGESQDVLADVASQTEASERTVIGRQVPSHSSKVGLRSSLARSHDLEIFISFKRNSHVIGVRVACTCELCCLHFPFP